MLPGKRGINLTLEQYKIAVSLQKEVGKFLGEEDSPGVEAEEDT